MPILDGLDEIPEQLRTEALNAIDRATHAESPVVITCRTEDYSVAIQRANSSLAQAAVIKIDMVAPGDAISYLRASTPLNPERWDKLALYLSSNPLSNVAETLRTPLMVYLTRAMFESSHTDSFEIANDRLFSSSAEIENYLLANYIRACYPSFPKRLGQRTNARNWDSKHAERWLRALSIKLENEKTLEFQWWRLAKPYMYVVTELINVAIVALFAFGGWLVFGSVLGHDQIGRSQPNRLTWEIYGLLIGLAVVVVPAGMLRLASRGTERMQKPGDRRLVLWHALAVSIIVSAIAVNSGRKTGSYISVGVVGGVIGFSCGYILWVLAGGIARPEWRSVVASGAASRMGCAGSLLVCLIFAPLPYIVAISTGSVWLIPLSSIPFAILFGGKGTAARMARGGPAPLMWEAAPAIHDSMSSSYSKLTRVGDVKLDPAHITDPITSVNRSLYAAVSDCFIVGAVSMLAILAISSPRVTVVIAGIFSVCVGIGSACSGPWGSFAVIRLWLWLRRKLPLRLMKFLDDATRRGILRQIGPTYVFRHSKVQKYLAKRL